MPFKQTSWLKARDESGVYQQILDGDQFKTFHTIEDIEAALDRHAKEFSTKGKYLICKETYRTLYDDQGQYIGSDDIVRVIKKYTAKRSDGNDVH